MRNTILATILALALVGCGADNSSSTERDWAAEYDKKEEQHSAKNELTRKVMRADNDDLNDWAKGDDNKLKDAAINEMIRRSQVLHKERYENDLEYRKEYRIKFRKTSVAQAEMLYQLELKERESKNK